MKGVKIMEKHNGPNQVYSKMCNLLEFMSNHPESVTDKDKNMLEKLYSLLCKTMGISEHSQWRIEWKVDKWADTARKLAGLDPDEVAIETQNIILDSGATELLKLISGTGGTPYNATNAYIYVGTDDTPENAAQVGILATGNNRSYAALDAGYPVVNGRQVIYRASFGDTSANFPWREASIVNGTGVNAVAMNRKVSSLGTKSSGTWTLQITISLTST